MARPPIPAPKRFWAKVQRTATCWSWTGWINDHGYGHFGVNNTKTVKAHRYAYELLVGSIPAGLVLDHLCQVRACVNPAHLEPVTMAENTRRAVAARQAVSA
jgi:hypothetical protein